MAKITRILAANICRQFFFVTNTAASTHCLAENFQLIYYSQRVSATKMTGDYHWIGDQENIGMFSRSQSDRNSFI